MFSAVRERRNSARFFVTHPHYLDTMLKLREINLRI